MNIILCGANGKMGNEIRKLIDDDKENYNIIAGIDLNSFENSKFPNYTSFNDIKKVNADCIIDFSHHTVTAELLNFALKYKIPIVLCTTGHTLAEKVLIRKASENIPIFYSANMSIGIELLLEFSKKITQNIQDLEIEIIEKHHNKKVDAPSGTALMFYNEIKSINNECFAVTGRNKQCKREKNEIGIHAVRIGDIVGEHEIIFWSKNQTITLTHKAHNRSLFAQGALNASKFIINQKPGIYNMKDLLKS